MSVPEHLWRFPTRTAITSLATRFGLPHTPEMQDWEWEVADYERIDEFLNTYETEDVTEDELFVLMEMLLQSFSETELDLSKDARWSRVMNHLNERAELHAYTIWYWSYLETEDPRQLWPVTPYVRSILSRHRSHWEKQNIAR